MTSNFVFRGQKSNGNLDATLDFLICFQKANTISEQLLKFRISYSKNEWQFGYNSKFLISL